MTGERVPLVSVVVFAREPLASLPACLQSLAEQEHRADMEVILADGCGPGVLDDLCADFPWVHRLELEPANMAVLKAQGIAAARGEIVAILEPRDAAGPTWVGEILTALADEGLDAVGGAVRFEGPRTATNLAAYLFNFAAFAPPFDDRAADDLPGNNLALRRARLRETAGDLLETMGFVKPFCQARLLAAGGRMALRAAMEVRHLAASRAGPFLRQRYHHGRCFGADRIRLAPPRQALVYRLFGPAVPALLLLHQVRRAWRHPGLRPLLLPASPMLLAACLAWGLGECLGYWLGPGRSCDLLF